MNALRAIVGDLVIAARNTILGFGALLALLWIGVSGEAMVFIAHIGLLCYGVASQTSTPDAPQELGPRSFEM